MDDELCRLLAQLEIELLRPSVRVDTSRLDALLHPEFVELGRSGRRYLKADILARPPSEAGSAHLRADGFALRLLAPEVALLTYRSAQVRPDGKLGRFTVRSSIWQRTQDGWRLGFHQGTPTEPFDASEPIAGLRPAG